MTNQTQKAFLLISILVITMTAFNSCVSKKGLNSTNLNAITFGSGGGFTGAVTKYHINTKGEVFEIKTFEKTTRQIKKISKEELKSIYKKIDEISGNLLIFNHPGNFYYFIELEKGNEKINILWGDPTFTEPKEVSGLYEYLNKLVKPSIKLQ